MRSALSSTLGTGEMERNTTREKFPRIVHGECGFRCDEEGLAGGEWNRNRCIDAPF